VQCDWSALALENIDRHILMCVNKKNKQSFCACIDEKIKSGNLCDDCVRISPLFTSMHINIKEKSAELLPITITMRERVK